MTDFFKHAAARDLPKYLFRTFHNGSFNQYDKDEGISSGDPSIWIGNWDEAHEALSDHMDVFNRSSPTPFVSVYKDRRKAKELAERCLERGDEGVTIAIIYVRKWKKEWWRVLEIDPALDYCQIRLPTQAAIDATESECLVYGGIPRGVIRLVPAEEFYLS